MNTLALVGAVLVAFGFCAIEQYKNEPSGRELGVLLSVAGLIAAIAAVPQQ
jgi:hypothetical protein